MKQRHWHEYRIDGGRFTGRVLTYGDTPGIEDFVASIELSEGCALIECAESIDRRTQHVCEGKIANCEPLKEDNREWLSANLLLLEQKKIRPMSELALNPQDENARARLAAIERQMSELRAELNK